MVGAQVVLLLYMYGTRVLPSVFETRPDLDLDWLKEELRQ